MPFTPESARRAAVARWADVPAAERRQIMYNAATAGRSGCRPLGYVPDRVGTKPCLGCGSPVRNIARERYCGAEQCRKAKNRERQTRYMHERRARLRANEWEKFDPAEVFERDGWVCQICMAPVDRDAPGRHPMSVSLDHIQPVSLGGPHTRENTRCAHFGCNARRGNRTTAA